MMKTELYLCGFPPQDTHPSLIMRKTPDKSQLKDILQTTSPVVLKTVKIIRTRKV